MSIIFTCMYINLYLHAYMHLSGYTFREALPRQKQSWGTEETEGVKGICKMDVKEKVGVWGATKTTVEMGKNVLSEVRLAIQCVFKPCDWKLPVELLSAEAAGTNLENLCKSTPWCGINESSFLRRKSVTKTSVSDQLRLLVFSTSKGCLPGEFEAAAMCLFWRIASGVLKARKMIRKLSGQLLGLSLCAATYAVFSAWYRLIVSQTSSGWYWECCNRTVDQRCSRTSQTHHSHRWVPSVGLPVLPFIAVKFGSLTPSFGLVAFPNELLKENTWCSWFWFSKVKMNVSLWKKTCGEKSAGLCLMCLFVR